MREIKFRFTLKNKDDGSLLISHIVLNNEKNGLIQFPIDLEKWEILRIEQYTGLKDKNGKEIYEGDILKHTFSELVEWVVSFKDGAFGITNLNCSTFYPCDSSTFFIDREIIGNIHEGEEE